MWDGKDLKEMGDLDFEIDDVLWIAPEQSEVLLKEGC